MSDVAWTVRRLGPGDDLARIVAELENAAMAEGEPVSVESLAAFLADERNVYLAVHVDGRLAGTLHAIQQLHPSGRRELYVDEVDTAEAFRRRGVAASMMRAACEIARSAGATAVWLGTEADNAAANALYASLGAQRSEPVVLYTVALDRA